MTTYTPAQVFACIKNNAPVSTKTQMEKKADILPISTSLGAEANTVIQVSATGQLALTPDRSKMIIVVSSQKDQVDDVKNSVQRRLDYILQTLSTHQVKEGDIHITKMLQREDSYYKLDVEVVSHYTDFTKCQAIHNLLVEKLDESVRVSLPEFYHSPHKLENLRRQASLLAVRNAKQKATEMSQCLHSRLGRVIAVTEESSREWDGPAEGSTEVEDQPVAVQSRIQSATTHVLVKTSITFQLKPRTKSKDNNK